MTGIDAVPGRRQHRHEPVAERPGQTIAAACEIGGHLRPEPAGGEFRFFAAGWSAVLVREAMLQHAD